MIVIVVKIKHQGGSGNKKIYPVTIFFKGHSWLVMAGRFPASTIWFERSRSMHNLRCVVSKNVSSEIANVMSAAVILIALGFLTDREFTVPTTTSAVHSQIPFFSTTNALLKIYEIIEYDLRTQIV